MTVPSALTGVRIGAQVAIPGSRGAQGDLKPVVTVLATRLGVTPAKGKGHREPESHHRGTRSTNEQERSHGASRERREGRQRRERRERSRGSSAREGGKSNESRTTGGEVRGPGPLPVGPLPDEEHLRPRSPAAGEAWPEEVQGSCRPMEPALREGRLGAEGRRAQRGAAGKDARAKKYGSRTSLIPDGRARAGPAYSRRARSPRRS
jgi:hypothetical protein